MKSVNHLKIKTPLYFALTLGIGMFFGTVLQKAIQKDNTTNSRLSELKSLIQKYYVDDVNVDTLFTKAIVTTKAVADSTESILLQNVLEKLDPHSNYLPPTILKQTNEEMKGEFAGIGIEYALYKDTVVVNYIVPKGPADNAALKVGDKLLKVNDSGVANNGITSTKLRKLLRGEANSKVKLTMLRNSTPVTITVTRGVVPIPCIDAAYMINSTLGYIRLNKFSFNSHTEFIEALSTLKQRGMTELIFDLRENGGGSLTDAVNILDEFIADKTLVTYTQGAHSKKVNYFTNYPGAFEQGKLFVLIDEFSASASEVVAGALQDLDRATIIGRRSYGKGLVQRQFGLSDNSAIRLTVAKYYTPSGRCIQKPYNNDRKAYNEDIAERYHHSGLLNADSNLMDKSQQFKTVKGRIVYGGGGIMPDYFIPIDTGTLQITILNKIAEKNCVNEFVLQYYFTNSSRLANYKSAAQFAKEFTLTNSEWSNFMMQCKANGVAINNMNAATKKYLEERVVQLIARQIWRSNGYYEVLNKADKVVRKAVELQ